MGVNDHKSTATRIASKSVDSSWTEHSAQVHVSMSVTFEGSVKVTELRKQVKLQFKAAIEEAMRSVARELKITSVQVEVMPLVTDFASIDSADLNDQDDWPSIGDDIVDVDEDPDLDEDSIE